MMSRVHDLAIVAAFALVGSACTSTDHDLVPPPVAAAQPPPPVRMEHPAKVQRHMKWHVEELRVIERSLLAGKLEDAKVLAFLVSVPDTDPGLQPWSAESTRVVAAAQALGSAKSVDDGLRKEAQLVAACAECHLHAQKLPGFARPPPLPPDEPTPVARMARHQWAADRLLEGMVGAGDPRWRSGLDVLAVTPLPFSRLTNAPALADRLRERATQAIASSSSESFDDRATTYGEILVTCAACHTMLHTDAR